MLRKLRNLWRLSGLELTKEEELPLIIKKSKQAKIIDMAPITSDIPQQDDYSA